MNFDDLLKRAIALAENEYRSLQAQYDASFRRTHPNPSRYRQRKNANFLDAKFSEATPTKDF